MRRKIFKIIFHRKPLVYACIYLLLIPTFALFYTLLPYHFYHSTAKFEYSVLNPKADEILDNLKSIIQNNYENNYGFKVNVNSPKIIDIQNISLSSLKSENDRFYFKLCYSELFKVKPQDSVYAYSYGCYDLSFSHKPFLVTIDPKTNQQIIYKEIKIENPEIKIDTQYFRNDIKDLFYSKEYHVPLIKIDNGLDNKLNEFGRTLYGFPTSFCDNYWRMFYFSSVTITTLGFGDIVPVTNKARNLISVEAILGVVLIGLFLNALSRRKNE
jgi:hypothetical protein